MSGVPLADLRALAEQRGWLVQVVNGNPITADGAWALIHCWDALVEVAQAAQALYERVKMDEAVDICLSDRVDALRLGAALASLGGER